MTDTAPSSRLLLLGRGRMGRLVEALSGEYGFAIVGSVDRENAGRSDDWPEADVAIDFSTGDAVAVNFPALARRGQPVVIGTTGWAAHEAAIRQEAEARGIAVVAAPNFALGVSLFGAIVGRAAELMARRPEFGAWVHELHHSAKRDAPSGTALALMDVMRGSGYSASIDVSSTRAGAIPGTHTIGFDGGGETITLTHSARDRSIFARGALEAARWVRGRQGWFTMQDVLGVGNRF
jgi:4-hydroxy-tetrahydrodipicolinate reductase